MLFLYKILQKFIKKMWDRGEEGSYLNPLPLTSSTSFVLPRPME